MPNRFKNINLKFCRVMYSEPVCVLSFHGSREITVDVFEDYGGFKLELQGEASTSD